MFEFLTQIFQAKKTTQQAHIQQPIHAIEALEKGYFYAIPREKGGYNVLKVLGTDDIGVHIRQYSNVYSSIPANLDIKTLYIAAIEDQNDQIDLGMGHLPISFNSFMTWNAMPLNIFEAVTDDELEGYHMWQDAEGGYF